MLAVMTIAAIAAARNVDRTMCCRTKVKFCRIVDPRASIPVLIIRSNNRKKDGRPRLFMTVVSRNHDLFSLAIGHFSARIDLPKTGMGSPKTADQADDSCRATRASGRVCHD